jgi:hypothetical protein
VDELRSQYLNLKQWSEEDKSFANAHIIAVAMTYFHRFFLRRSVFEYEALNVAFTCLFLAAKVQEMSLTHETFCKTFKQDPVQRNLLHHEQVVIDVIQY